MRDDQVSDPATRGGTARHPSPAGLERGDKIGSRAGQRGKFLGALVLIGVDVAFGTGII